MYIPSQTHKYTHFCRQQKLRKIDFNSRQYLQGTCLTLDNGMYIPLKIKSSPPTATSSNLQTHTHNMVQHMLRYFGAEAD